MTTTAPGTRRQAIGAGGPARIPVLVAGLGAAIPAACVTNDDLARRVETSDDWIVERTGIRERRNVSASQSTSDLGIVAARAALADAGASGSAIDLLIVATTTPDQPMPSTASWIAGALGVHGAAFDLNAACSGWVYGLVTASALMAANVGSLRAGSTGPSARRGAGAALLVGAEVMSKWMDPADRSTLPLFGDGAAATVLLPTEADAGLLAWDLGVDGDAAPLLQVPAGGSRRPLTGQGLAAGDQYLKMEGREVFRRAVRAVASSCQAVLDDAAVQPGDVALFVPHQANSRIVDAILPRLGLTPGQTMMNIARYGNTSAASVPLALCEAAAAGLLVDGDLVLLAGFGAGMTWASALLRWGYTGAGPSDPIVLPA